MSVPRIIILFPPPKWHIDTGSHTEEDCLPVAGRFIRPGSEGTAIRRRRGTSTSTTATRTGTTGITRTTTGGLECVRAREDDNDPVYL